MYQSCFQMGNLKVMRLKCSKSERKQKASLRYTLCFQDELGVSKAGYENGSLLSESSLNFLTIFCFTSVYDSGSVH